MAFALNLWNQARSTQTPKRSIHWIINQANGMFCWNTKLCQNRSSMETRATYSSKKSIAIEVKQEVRSWFHHLLVVWPQVSDLTLSTSFLSSEKLVLFHKYIPGVIIMLLSRSALPFDNVKKTVRSTEFGTFQKLGFYPQFKAWWVYHWKEYVQHVNIIWKSGQWITIGNEP